MSLKLDGKVAIVTGGGAGIGAAIAKAFVNEGAKVLISGRRKEKLEEFSARFKVDDIDYYAGDVTKVEDCEAMVEKAVSRFGKLDILVNNAGIDPPGTVTEIPIDQWLNIVNTNLNGVFYMTRFSIPKMIEQGGGSIINIASLASVRIIPAMPAYCTTKAALIGFTGSVALDYGDKGIRANAISPGATASDMLKHSMAGLASSQNTDIYGAFGILTRFNPIKRAAEPDEIAPVAVFFASDDSKYITGQNLLVDGGATVVDPCGSALNSVGMAWGDE
jgi:Dehydrogenases with different specificities (related to short-chain alcohol dehydrogenases)